MTTIADFSANRLDGTPEDLAAYKGKVVEGLYKGLSGLVKSRGIDVVNGFGRLVDLPRLG